MTDVDSEMETVANQSAARDVYQAAPTQKDGSSGSHSTPGIHTGTSTGPHFFTILKLGAPPFAYMGAYPGSFPSNTVTLPSCLMPESLTSCGDFEDHLQQFNNTATLSSWYLSRHEHRLRYFVALLLENDLHFYTTLSPNSKLIIKCLSMISGRTTHLMSRFQKRDWKLQNSEQDKTSPHS